MKNGRLFSTGLFAPLFVILVCVLLTQCNFLFQPQKNPGTPIVVITFDDAHPSVYSYSYPTMRLIDSTWGATHFFPATYAMPPGSTITVDQAKEMEAHGWETGGHGYTHENLSSVPIDSVEKQIQMDYNFLVGNNLSHESFAYPYGNYNSAVAKVVNKYFKNIRTSHDFEYLDGVNRTELGYFAVKPGMTADDVIARIEKARHDGSPLVIIGFHAVIADSVAALPIYWCRESVFYSMLVYLKKEEFTVLTLKNAMKKLCE
jgi:peptidoglycan/xylan/chitin deacetylase (PgdA/CDA1 family)